MNAYITEAGYLLIETDRNGKTIYGDEIGMTGTEEVEWPESDVEKNKIGTAEVVWAVVDKDEKVLTEQLPFYFEEGYARAGVKLMNKSVVTKNKPYCARKVYLVYPLGATIREVG